MEFTLDLESYTSILGDEGLYISRLPIRNLT